MKTPKDFDYDLWKTADGRHFIRLKCTGEVCEVDVEIFRELRNEAMRMYRKLKGTPTYGVKKGKSVVVRYTTVLSLNHASREDDKGDVWCCDSKDFTLEIITNMLDEEFRKSLTDKQLDVYLKCLFGDETFTKYAQKNGICESAVRKTVTLIRKKAKIFFA